MSRGWILTFSYTDGNSFQIVPTVITEAEKLLVELVLEHVALTSATAVWTEVQDGRGE
jgi:hypothetical protein